MVFNKLDTNGDGVISRKEFDAYNAKHFKELDTNKDGKLTLEELTGGTFSISIFPFAPMKRISVKGSSFLSAFAMASAGNMCPPVPPPAMMILRAMFRYAS